MNTSISSPAAGSPAPVGQMVRSWRQRRRLSQMELALDAGVSTRHLSFIETGRSKPSPQMLIALAERLDVPLRERNALLLAAGYAPRYPQRSFDAPDMRPVRDALNRLLEAHHPFPGVVVDRHWNVVSGNKAAMALADVVPQALRTPHLNIYRATLHPDGLARYTRNLEEWAVHLLRNLRRSVEASADPVLVALEAEVLAYPRMRQILQQAPERDDSPLLVFCTLDLPTGALSMFRTLTSFGTPRDVTLDELCVELFYPVDAASDKAMRALSQ